MNRVFIFSNDDFREVNTAELEEMTTSKLIESLQGTLIGLHTVKEVTDRVDLVNMGPYTEFKKTDNDINARLVKGLAAIVSQLEPKLGKEGVERVINQTLFMIQFENQDQDGKQFQ